MTNLSEFDSDSDRAPDIGPVARAAQGFSCPLQIPCALFSTRKAWAYAEMHQWT